MSGKSTRAKGRRGQSAAANLLRDRDWTVADLSAGTASEDLLATDPDGKTYAVEVKNTIDIRQSHVRQAQEQAALRKLPWMLMNKIAGSRSWLVRRHGEQPWVWVEK